MINTSLAPTRNFDRMNQFMEEMFGNRFESLPWSKWTPWYPAVDIIETVKDYTFVMEVPGFNQENISVELSNDVLTIYGKRERKFDESKETYVRHERYYGEFKRSFKMDTHVRPDSISATFRDGLLTVFVPKIEPVKPTKIDVKP